MIKTLLFNFLIFIGGCKIQHQAGVLLKPSLLPNRVYKTTVISIDNQIIEYVGNQTILDSLQAKGIEYPITSNTIKTIISRQTTGAKSANGVFSFVTNFEAANAEISGSITKLEKKEDFTAKLKGIKIYGHSNEELQMKVDSIVGANDKSFEASLKQSMESMFQQINFPNEFIQVEKSFEIESPMKLPTGGGAVFDFVINNTYTLDSIKHRIAYFSIEQNIEMKNDILRDEITLSGEGAGRLYFDIENKSIQLFETETKMNTMVKLREFEVHTKGITKSTTITNVE